MFHKTAVSHTQSEENTPESTNQSDVCFNLSGVCVCVCGGVGGLKYEVNAVSSQVLVLICGESSSEVDWLLCEGVGDVTAGPLSVSLCCINKYLLILLINIYSFKYRTE